MELHCYTLEHVLNFCDKYAGCAKPAVPYNYSESYCPFCRKDVDSSSHLVKADHIGKSHVKKRDSVKQKIPINDTPKFRALKFHLS